MLEMIAVINKMIINLFNEVMLILNEMIVKLIQVINVPKEVIVMSTSRIFIGIRGEASMARVRSTHCTRSIGGDQDEADATNHWPDHSSGFIAAKFHWGTENTKTSIIDYENGHFDHAVLRSDDVRKKKRMKNGVRSGGGGPVSREARGRA